MKRVSLLAVALLLAIPAISEAQLRVGGSVQPPALVKRVEPAYPQLARSAKVAGTVILEIQIDTEGRVASAKVLRPIALLTEAAVEAVRQWRYAPTSVNGVATEVVMTVTVDFSLDERQPKITATPGVDVAQLIDDAKALHARGQADAAARTLQIAVDQIKADLASGAHAGPAGKPLRVGGLVKQPVLIKEVAPTYPAAARQAGVTGTVIIEAVIARTGEVADARVVRSIPLLDEAALAAVRQRLYAPTLLNGEPVAVILTVSVNFPRR
jgi:protein TonB